ncbi:MAG TPA: HD-GYP domain-containing protein [Solirubrobacteraceae bacterium]
MALEPTVEEQDLLADTLRRASARMSFRERAAETVAGVGLFAVTAGLWLANPPHAFSLLAAATCLVVLVVATMVRFETPFGFTAPIQLAFVPLLFAMPVALIPLAVAGALIAARSPDVLRGQVPAMRLLHTPANAWFAIGPCVVFTVAGVSPDHASAGLLIVALLAQFAIDFFVLSLRLTIERSATLASQIRESWVYVIDAALAFPALVVAAEMDRYPLAPLALVPLLAILAIFANERRRRLESLLELGSAYRGTALVLGDVVEADDGYTGEHCKSVVELTMSVAGELGLGAANQRNLEFGALLHDVGKIAIPKSIINKPGKLDPEEWSIIKTHTIEGQKMLERVGGFMRDVGQIVRSHHERWDGTGYPDGLAGEAIPIEARIVGCCDAWNAMRTDRSYRKALPYETAVSELLDNSGTQFDPRVVSALLRVVQDVGDIRPPDVEEIRIAPSLSALATARPVPAGIT